MSQKPKSRFMRLLTIYLRRFRLAVLFVSFVLLGIFFYLNQIGLPDFAKRPLLASLRERGVDLEFERMRLRWQHGIVADNVRFGSMSEPAAPRLFAREVQIKIQRGALLHGKVEVDGLRVLDGRMEWQSDKTNAPLRALNVSDIQTRLRLLPGDRWMLDDFRARFAGAQFHVSASITNASAFRDLELFKGGGTAGPSRWPERLRALDETLAAVKFATPPDFNLDVEGDARRLESFAVKFTVITPGAETPWGRGTNILFTARLFPAYSNELTHAAIQIEAQSAETPWASATNVNLHLNLISLAPEPELASAELSLHADEVRTQWAGALGVILNASWIHSITNPIPLSARVTLGANVVSTRWAGGDGVHVEATLSRTSNAPAPLPTLGFWTNLLAYQSGCQLSAMKLRTEKLSADSVSAGIGWNAPSLTVSNLHADLSHGSLHAQAQLDVITRELLFGLESDFDTKQIVPLLNAPAREWLGQVDLQQPPHLRGSGTVTLPEWTNAAPDWTETFSHTLRLAGEFAITNCAYRGIHADWARSHLSYTNFQWQLPDLEVAAPQGRLRLSHWTDNATQNYYWRIQSTLHPDALNPLLTEKQKRSFDYVKLASAPVVDGELWGNWRDNSRFGFRGNIAVSNVTVRSETIDAVVSDIQYTNGLLHFYRPQAWYGTQSANAKGLMIDFEAARLYFTNGYSTLPPFVITRAIGPITHRSVEPYVFVNPPVGRADGYISLRGSRDVDIHFDLDGGPFEWWKFHVPKIRGHVHWMGDSLVLTNVETLFYEGWADGSAYFNFAPPVGTDFAFTLNTTNANLHLLLADLYSPTNTLEGQLSGTLAVTNANSNTDGSWNGFGRAQLQDGLIWSIPVFGILSKPLDAIVPGLGNSRITEAKTWFTITNSVIHSGDLEMRTPTSRLQYSGTVDFSGKVNARVEAELFRDTWLIGRLVSFALWPVTKMFEFKVTGRLNEPKMEPLYIPKLIMMPLHPIKTLEELFPPPTQNTNSPAPPITPPN
ncbi:MAG: hypothetical protein HOP33_06530 [Verrucomicrobia bacterium]|nr:hypothetical protein [Verrucomicrobiota bacterium]